MELETHDFKDSCDVTTSRLKLFRSKTPTAMGILQRSCTDLMEGMCVMFRRAAVITNKALTFHPKAVSSSVYR